MSNGIEKIQEVADEPAMHRAVWALFLIGSAAFAADELTLDPVVVNAVPADILSQDSVVPKQKIRTDPVSSSGSIGRSLLTRTTLPISETGIPGEPSSVRGSGRSADDLDARIFGVPMNPPQGGGFNFSSFPSFLWSEVRYQPGPGLSGSEPRAVSGQLQLVPWSFEALNVDQKQSGFGARQFFSSAGILQTAAMGTTGLRDGSGVAGVMGVSEGSAKGPSGSFSAVKNLGENKLRFHLIGTNIRSDSLGTVSYVTPRASIENARVIPVLQFDTSAIQTSAFAELARIDYRDPDSSLFTLDLVQQVGANTVYKKQGWRLGLGGRYVYYRARDRGTFKEAVGQIQITRTQAFSEKWVFEPSLALTEVTSFSVYPVWSAGLSRTDTWGGEIYFRAGASRRTPSLLDRHYGIAGFFVPNPNLKPEFTTTAILGWQKDSGDLTLGSRFQGQQITDARVMQGLQPVNAGKARILSWATDASFQWNAEHRLNSSFLVNLSELEAPGRSTEPFFGLPAWTQIGSWDWDKGRWGTSLAYRWTSGFKNSFGPSVGPTVYADWSGRYRVNSTFEVGARVDNLWDANVRLAADYPRLLRRFSLLLSATF
ncbi:MAG: TonB-dependent receptor [Bdellovibrionales bacterium]|nr:TonB-dependent receptor [Bdellovibrionales bacterium]